MGTLRTYAIAWLLAKSRGEKLFVRFDAHNLVAASPRERRWAIDFLDELRDLEMSPDHWEYLETKGRAVVIPEWAILKYIPWGHDANGIPIADGPKTHIAYYPSPVTPRMLPSSEPADYPAGDPMTWKIEESPSWGYFAVRDGNEWAIDETLVCVQQMAARCTSTIVRSHLSAFLRPYMEAPAAEWFGYRLPEVFYCDVVCDGERALSKHRLKPGDPGTVAYSMERLGPAELRRRILEDTSCAGGQIIAIATGINRDWREVVGHD